MRSTSVRNSIVCAGALAALAGAAGPVRAEGFTIACGQTIAEAFDFPGEPDTYTFEAAGGETVAITTPTLDFFSTTSQPEPCWQLFAPPATPGGPAEAVGAAVCQNQAVRTLPRPGTYTIKVTDAGDNETGAYRVSLEVVSGRFSGQSNGPPTPVCARPDVQGNAGDGTQPIACGETKLGDFELGGETDTYTFVAAGGETVAITTPTLDFFSTTSQPEPCWELFAPPAASGGPAERLGTAVCQGQGERTLPRAGVYTIKLYDAGHNEAGAYRVTLETVSGRFNGHSNGPPTPFCARADVQGNEDDGTQPIACGETKVGSFEVGGETDTYTFAAAGGETVAITTPTLDFFSTTSQPEPCWRLFAPPAGAGEPAQALGGEVCQGQAERTLPRAGVYTIKVYDAGHSETGAYRISLEVVSGGFDGQSNGPPDPVCARADVNGGPGDGTQPIGCTETKPADFEAAGETDTFTFTANGGETVSITTPTLDPFSTTSRPEPCWQLFAPPAAPNQPAERIGAARCQGSEQRLLPRAGVYTIKTFDSGHNESGAYTVSLNFLGPPPPGCSPTTTTTVTTSTTTTTTTTTSTSTTTTTRVASTTTTTLPGPCAALRIGSGEGFVGSRVRVPVVLDSNPPGDPIAAVNFTLTFDDARLGITPTDVHRGSAAEAVDARLTPDVRPGEVTAFIVPRFQTNPAALPDGAVADLDFLIQAGAPGQALELCAPAGGVAAGGLDGFARCVDLPACGAVRVVDDCRQGDCNRDQVVDQGDLVCLTNRFFDGASGLGALSACEDCNADRSLDSADAVCTVLCAFGRCPVIGVPAGR